MRGDHGGGAMSRHAIVTGGSRGIGYAIATHLANEGYRVSIVGRDASALERAAVSIGKNVDFIPTDVMDATSVNDSFSALIERNNGLDILVNNAGAAESASFSKTGIDLWRRMIDINLTSVYHCIQAASPALLGAEDARVINIASTAGQAGYAYVSAYCAAKHGVVGLTRALAREWATRSITVNAICPGYTDTDLVHRSIETIQRTTGRPADQALASLTRANPQQRLIQPSEVAAAVSWLCSPLSRSVTGQCISIAGGEVV